MVYNIKEKKGEKNVFIRKRLLRNMDYYIFAAVLTIITLGILMIYSATHANPADNNGDPFFYVKKQFFWLILGLIGMFGAMSLDYQILSKWSKQIYYCNLLLLIAVMVLGRSSLGAQRWIEIGPIVLQPSEFAKIFIIITLANHLQDKVGELKTMRDLFPAMLHVGIPMIFIMKQPDLGTSLVFSAIFLGMIITAGVNWRTFACLSGIIGAILPFFWHFLKEYQKKRLLVFLDPNVDPTGAGYHIIQSRIAIGSGGIFGKGLFAGTQSQLNFLPEHHTDFIFAVLGEELGLLGALVLLSLYFIIVWRGIKVATEAKDNFGTLIAVGVVSMLSFHLLVNIGMTSGIMPVTGIPLPFMSYGGSALLTNMVSIGLLLNVCIRKQKILF